MNISPVRRMRVPEEIVDQIRGLIGSGDLRPGDQLPSERELAEQFQVSRASIREALTAMQVMGLLERSRTGGGLAARGNHVWFTIAPLTSFLATRSHLVEQIEDRIASPDPLLSGSLPDLIKYRRYGGSEAKR